MTSRRWWLAAWVVGALPAAVWLWFFVTRSPQNPPMFWSPLVGFPFGAWAVAGLTGVYHLWRTPKERWNTTHTLLWAPAAAVFLTCLLPFIWHWQWAVMALGFVVALLQAGLWNSWDSKTKEPARRSL